jgi:hypothetical protein
MRRVNRVILTWNTYSTPATLHISYTLRPQPAMGLKSLGENAVVAEHG